MGSDRIIKFKLVKDTEIVGYENHVIDSDLGVGIGIYHNPLISVYKVGYPITGGDKWFIFHDKKYQYIGLKDKNGEEIYEGDILYLHEHCTAEVVYSKDGFKLKTICPQSEILSRFYSWNLCESIGNVYKNPELLKVR